MEHSTCALLNLWGKITARFIWEEHGHIIQLNAVTMVKSFRYYIESYVERKDRNVPFSIHTHWFQDAPQIATPIHV